MKRTILSFMMLSFFFVAMAQKSELSAAKNNYALFEIGLQTKTTMQKQLALLDLAKVSTDKAILNEKTKDLAELWAYRGIICSSIAVTDTVNKANAESAFKIALEAIAKAKALDTKKEQEKLIESADRNLTIMMQNKGVAAFKRNDFKEAFSSFKFIADVMPKDTLFNMYTAIAATNAKLYDEAIKYYAITIDINSANPSLYQELAKSYLSKVDTANALKTIEAGRIVHPDFMPLILDELNLYLAKGQVSKQIGKIENAVAKDPKNKTLLFVAGISYSANKQIDKAEASYKKALEIDPIYSDAIYNLSVIYINKGNDFIIAANKLPNNKASDAKYAELKGKFTKELSNAMPLLEKARELNPKDLSVLTTLREVYVKLGLLTKASEVKKAIDQL